MSIARRFLQKKVEYRYAFAPVMTGAVVGNLAARGDDKMSSYIEREYNMSFHIGGVESPNVPAVFNFTALGQ